jgi:hypothetical protein
MINIDAYIDVLEKHNLSQSQFMLLHLVQFSKIELLKRYMSMFPADDGTAIGKNNEDDLIDRGYLSIVEVDGKREYIVDLSKHDIFVTSNLAADEILNMYPTDQTISDLYQFTLRYKMSIDYDPKLHKKVKSIVKEAIKMYLIDCNILDFAISKRWEIWEEKINEIKYENS